MTTLILENVRSAYNVGAIFRTADAARVKRIYLVGYTPCPIDRFGRVQREIEKTSLGALQDIAWEHRSSIVDLIHDLHQEEQLVVAVEQASGSVPLSTFRPPESVAYIFGNEVEGVSREALHLVNTIVEIPMFGKKESLNVSVVAGIILYHGINA